jgi:hypothetical protein
VSKKRKGFGWRLREKKPRVTTVRGTVWWGESCWKMARGTGRLPPSRDGFKVFSLGFFLCFTQLCKIAPVNFLHPFCVCCDLYL